MERFNKVRVRDDVNGMEKWIPATELLSAMGVEVCATTVSELSAENAELQVANNRQANTISELSVKLDTIRAQFAETGTTSQVAELLQELSAVRNELDAREDSLKASNQAYELVRSQFDKAVDECRRLNAENARLRDELDTVAGIATSRLQRNDALLAQVDELTQANMRQQHNIAVLIEERDKLAQECKDWDETIVSEVIGNLRASHAQVDELTQTVANRDGLIAQQTDTIQRIIVERDDAVTKLINVRRAVNGLVMK